MGNQDNSPPHHHKVPAEFINVLPYLNSFGFTDRHKMKKSILCMLKSTGTTWLLSNTSHEATSSVLSSAYGHQLAHGHHLAHGHQPAYGPNPAYEHQRPNEHTTEEKLHNLRCASDLHTTTTFERSFQRLSQAAATQFEETKNSLSIDEHNNLSDTSQVEEPWVTKSILEKDIEITHLWWDTKSSKWEDDWQSRLRARIFSAITASLPSELYQHLPDGDVKGAYSNLISMGQKQSATQIVSLINTLNLTSKDGKPMATWLNEIEDIHKRLDILPPSSQPVTVSVTTDYLPQGRRALRFRDPRYQALPTLVKTAHSNSATDHSRRYQ